MERNSFSNSLKDHSVGNKAIKDKLKDSWSCNNQCFGEEDDYLNGFSWPPRSYTCSFCKREFRSAQALGGHMNVHRRDRARLRQSPPQRDLNLNPNPNPNFSSSSSLVSSSLISSTLPSQLLVSPSLSSLSSHQASAFPCEMKKWRVNNGSLIDPLSSNGMDSTTMKGEKSFFGVKEFNLKKKNKTDQYVTLDLEIGLVSDSKEDLDLELRLGYS